MIKNDLSHLPRADAVKGVQPDADPFIGRAVAAAWLLDNYNNDKPHAVEGTKFRFSMAGMCSRSLAYYFDNTTPTNLPDSADAWRMGLGTMVHEAVQNYLASAVDAWRPAEIGGAEVTDVQVSFEVPVHLPEISGSGSADMMIDYFGESGLLKRQIVELKTINGFGFKMSATGFKGPAQGPRLSHVQQAALCAHGLNADEMIICYLSMENVSPSLASSYCEDPEFGRFTAQWSYNRADIERVVSVEKARIANVIGLSEVADSPAQIAKQVYSDTGVLVNVSDPRTGAYHVTSAEGAIVDAGKTWACGYCRFQDQCVKDG